MAGERDEYPAWMMGALAGQGDYRRPDEVSWPDAPRPPMGSLAEQDRIVPPPLTPAEEMRRKELGALHGAFVEPVQDAWKALRGQMTPQEQEDLAFNAASNLLPVGKAAAATAGFGVGARGVLESLRMGELAKPFYSAAEQAVTGASIKQAPPAQWLGTLRNVPGVKPEEIERLGLPQWLGQQQGAVPKQAVADYIAANKVNVGEVRKSAAGPGWGPKFETYQLPGGENYRETLLTLPNTKADAINARMNAITQELHSPGEVPNWSALRGEYKKLADQLQEMQTFSGSHWDEPNVLAHYRTNDRDIGGKKTLFLEEVQSDWHQKGRQLGYRLPADEAAKLEARRRELETIGGQLRSEGKEIPLESKQEWADIMNRLQPDNTSRIPDAPFKTTWHELALKRAIRDAAEGGYDQIAWTPGKVQADRYDLSKQIGSLDFTHNRDFIGNLQARDHNGRIVLDRHIVDYKKDLPELIGKEAAEKLMAQDADMGNGVRRLSGMDLQVGGEGMKGFYDKMLPTAANKLGKKHGAQVGQQQMFEGSPEKWKPFQRPDGEWSLRHTDTGFEASPTYPTPEAAYADLTAGRSHAVHTLPITPSLREQALRKGFPMFVVGGATTVGGLAAQDNYPQ
jgi:hypothetical protein